MNKAVLTVFLLIIACSYSDAQDMPELRVIDIPSFSGGLNTRDGYGGIADNEYAMSMNCALDGESIKKRNGISEYAGGQLTKQLHAVLSFTTDRKFEASTASFNAARNDTTEDSNIANSIVVMIQEFPEGAYAIARTELIIDTSDIPATSTVDSLLISSRYNLADTVPDNFQWVLAKADTVDATNTFTLFEGWDYTGAYDVVDCMPRFWANEIAIYDSVHMRLNDYGIANIKKESTTNYWLLTSRDVDNVSPSAVGGVQGQIGYDQAACHVYYREPDTSVGTGITYAPFNSGGQVVSTKGDVIYKKSGDEWTDITGSVTVTSGEQVMFSMIDNNLVGVNGTDPAWYYTGSGNATTLSGDNIPTAPVSCETFHGRLFLAEDRRLYWSRYMADWLEFHPDDWQDFNEPIIALHVLGDVNNSILVVLCSHSIHYLAFDPSLGEIIGGRGTFRVDQISSMHGCVSAMSVQECTTPNGQLVLIWADADGLKMMNTSTTIVKITDKIDPTWDDLELSELDESVGFHYKLEQWYGLACRNTGSDWNDRVIIYDLRNFVVSGIFDWNMQSVGIIRDSGEDILVGSDNEGTWYQYNTGTDDDGDAIDAYFITKSYDAGYPILAKRYRSVNLSYNYYGNYDFEAILFLEAGADQYRKTITATSGYDTFDDEIIIGTSVLASDTEMAIQGAEIFGEGRHARMKIRNNSADEPFKIYRLQMTYEPGRMVPFR